MTITENSAPVVALARLIGWATSAPSRRADRASRALSAPQDGPQPLAAQERCSLTTQTASQPLCSVLGCAGAVVAAPHGWPLCSDHGVMMVAS